MNKAYFTGLIVVLVVASFLGVTYPKSGGTVVERVVETLGADAGPTKTEHQEFLQSYMSGGVFTIATTASAMTLTDSMIRNASVIAVRPVNAAANSAALALTTMSSTTWASLPDNGSKQSWIIDNQFSAAATTTTITAGAGVDIDGTGANDDVINGGVSGTLECWKYLAADGFNRDVRCIVQEFVDAG